MDKQRGEEDARVAIAAALVEFGDAVIGLVVQHDGYALELLYDEDGHAWCALGYPDATEDGEQVQANGDGTTPRQALDACARACRVAEDGGDSEDE